MTMPSVFGRAQLLVALAALCLGLVEASFAAPGAHGPGGEHLDAPGNVTNTSALARLADGSVNVPKAAQRRMGIRTALAPVSQAAATAELSGRVVPDPNASGRVQAIHGGRVEAGPRGLPFAGQPVRRGETLAYVRHHAEPYALASQQAQLAELRTQRELAEQRAARLEQLDGTVPRKEIDAARAEARSLTERERAIGASLGAREVLVAPVDGVIARADVAAGQVIESGHVLFEITDPARMLVEATTADASLAARIGGAHLEGLSDAQLKLVGSARAFRDGVLPLTFTVHGAKRGASLPIAIGQPVTVVVSLGERLQGVVLPTRAIARSPANEPIVWIKSGAERFIPQPVRYRPLDAGTVLVTEGLGADNRVVVEGAALIAQIR